MKLLFLAFIFIAVIHPFAHASPAWKPTNGPVMEGGALSIASDSRGFLYAITDGASLYRRAPQDAVWTYLRGDAYAIAIDRNDNAYVGRDMGFIDMYDKNFQFLKIVRYGGIWDGEIESIIPDAGGNLYTITAGNDLTSLIDTSQIWNIIRDHGIRDIDVDSGKVAIMNYFGFLFRSLDTGRTWTPINIKDDKDFRVVSIEYDKKHETWMAICRGRTFYISTDSGLTWTQRGDVLPLTYVREFYVSKSGATYIAYDSAAYRSSDGGVTWFMLPGLDSVMITGLVEEGENLFITNESHSVIKYNLTTQRSEPFDRGFILSYVTKVAVNIDGTVFATTYEGIYKSTDEGGYWELIQFPGGVTGGKEVYCTKSGLVFARDNNAAYVSRDFGASWERVKMHPDSGYISPQVMAEDDRGRLYAGYNGIIYSDDAGVNWERVELYYTYKNIQSIACYGDILAFTVQTEGPFISKDRGATYHNLQFPVNYDNGHPDSYVRFNSKGELYVFINRAHSPNMINRSSDSGKTFVRYDNLREDTGLIVLDSADNLYSIGQRSRKYPNGLIRSTDGGASWSRYSNDDIKYYESNDICFGRNGKAYLALASRGVFRNDNVMSLREPPVVEDELIISPNPAGEEISIRIASGNEKFENWIIQIVNEYGEIVYKDRLNGMSGSDKARIGALPQGIYFVRVISGGRTFAGKFVISR